MEKRKMGKKTMRIMIKYRLFLSMLAATAAVVVSMFLVMQWSFDRGFLQYVNTTEQERLERLAGELEQVYSAEGSWKFLAGDAARWYALVAATFPDSRDNPEHAEVYRRWLERRLERHGVPSRAPVFPPRFANSFDMRVMLLDVGHMPVAGSPPAGSVAEFKELRYKGDVVGYLGLVPRKHLTDAHQLSFMQQQKLAMALVAGILFFVSAGISLPLANHLVRPIKILAVATHRLASGGYGTRVEIRSSDELGQLGRDFNTLALSLEQNEQLRRQWVADISHELRTPLSVLRGEIEAIQDGIRSATPDAVRSLHGEVMRLSRLVDDLYQLSLSDVGALSYRKTNLRLADLLDEALDPFRGEFVQKGIALIEEIPADAGFRIYADPERLHQLFANLLDNALKYTDGGGELTVRLERRDGTATVHFMDSAPGVPEEALERLFERLFRVEASRSRASGGAGLGLAICRNIVEAHEGTITALPSPKGGVWIRVDLPLAEETA